MKIIQNISLAGFPFVIEEDAFQNLTTYLNSLEKSLPIEDRQEVMQDIEYRMVDILCEEKSGDGSTVISQREIDIIIQKIGRPEIILEQSATENPEQYTTLKQKRSLYRDMRDVKIGGVCSGLAKYFDIPVRYIRLGLILFFVLDIFTTLAIPTSFIVVTYLILWMVLPAARYPSDFLKMEGKTPDFNNLKEKSQELVQFGRRSTKEIADFYNSNKPVLERGGSVLEQILKYGLGGFSVLTSLVFFIASFSVFRFFQGENLSEQFPLRFYLGSQQADISLIIWYLLCLIPAVIFGVIAVKLLSKKVKFKGFRYLIATLILTLIALVTFLSFNVLSISGIEIKSLKNKANYMKVKSYSIPVNPAKDSNKTIYIKTLEPQIPSSYKRIEDDIYSDNRMIVNTIEPNVSYSYDDVSTPKIKVIQKNIPGKKDFTADYPLKMEGNKIYIPTFILYHYKNRFRFPNISYEITLPEGYRVINSAPEAIEVEEKL